MIGRIEEQRDLTHWLHSGRSEFIVVYGRRRVGKTYLVNEFFRNRFAFHATGVSDGDAKIQLETFNGHLRECGLRKLPTPESWFEAFDRLKELLSSEDVVREPATGRAVVFIDEMPWMDTPKSNFKPAFEHFWNSWAAQRKDILLVACGSASSWLTKNLLANAGGLYGRVTGSIALQPFTLGECEGLLEYNNVYYSRPQIIELFEIFGGIPYYMNLLRGELSPAQNVDRLCFATGCQLQGEFDLLYRSLFKHPENYLSVVRALASCKGGLANSELRAMRGLPTGASLGRVLEDLELCGLIRKVDDFTRRKKGQRFQLIDPYTRFHLEFMERKRFDSWAAHVGTPSYLAWRGTTFELVCSLHSENVKRALGISGTETRTCAWRSDASDPGAQIDLVLDRRDGIIDLCEAKFTDGEYAIDKSASMALATKRDVFRAETGTKKALRTVLISVNGLSRNKYYHDANAVVVGDDLFTTA